MKPTTLADVERRQVIKEQLRLFAFDNSMPADQTDLLKIRLIGLGAATAVLTPANLRLASDA